MVRLIVLMLSAVLLAAPAASARDAGTPAQSEPRTWESRGQVSVNGERIRYRAIAGEMFLRDADETPTAAIFHTTYLREGVSDPRNRPVAFIFNGGPGSASLWLHMGMYGPQRVVLPSDPADDGAAPYTVRENPETLLDAADLVFIDPVGTGWSRTLGETQGSTFWGVNEDAEAISQFMRRWLSEHQRWNSPKYLIGESYGTTRIGALMRQLELSWNNVAVNGVVLVSTILDFSLNRTHDGNEIAFAAAIPGYAATAWYHDLVDRSAWDGDHDRFLNEARAFASNEYLPAILAGQSLPRERQNEIAARYAAFTGLSADFVRRAELRVSLNRFRTELLRDQGLSVGRFDSRFTGIEPDAARENPEGDPSGYGIDGAYTAAMLDHFTRNLGVDITRPYVTLGGIPSWNWDAGEAGGRNSYVNVATWIARAMRQNHDLRVFAANGIYDLATPFYPVELVFNRPGFDRDQITLTYYEAGHMMYLHQPSIEALARDTRDFIRDGRR
ncbi:peptidase S10 [Alkalicaulis satelles]|uniref:Peptidase S10 n=1 Tax=Alkalicaulis satelles TaxID=2609175 RepID=A0A5M6Z8S0_9PROT|nr:peptidase S10 [Alkalicaulis satelles]KAA5801046.1 peptidase S10 [Alkalicaulis satelles]